MMTVTQNPHQYNNRQQLSDESSGSEAEGCCAAQDSSDEDAKGPIASQPAYIRLGFIRKVYSLLMVQLLLTFFIALPFQFDAVIPKGWLRRNAWLMYACSFGALAVICCMSCCGDAGKRFPSNYFLLFAFTILESVTIGFVTAFYTAESVMLALLTTVVIFGALTAYACFTKTDFTGLGPYLFCALFALVGFSLVLFVFSAIFGFNRLRPLHVLLSFCAVILFSCYIVYDTQLIVGGKHRKHKFEVDDYVFAALNLYLDVVNLFLNLLSIMGKR